MTEHQLADSMRQAIMEEARRWLGTPFRHQARVCGVGSDCIQTVFGVGIATGLMPWSEDRWAPYRGYSPVPNPNFMRRALVEFLVEIDAVDAAVGDICWLEWRDDLPMHLALLLEHKGRPTILHSYIGMQKCVEHGFTAEWPDRVNSWWRYPRLAQAVAAVRGG